jgi:hypothetical protein
MPPKIGNPHGYPDYTYPMIWVLQDGELWPIEQWVAHVGVDKHWLVDVTLAAGNAGYVEIYTVPAGKKLYVTHMTFRTTAKGTMGLYIFPGSIGLDSVALLAYCTAPSLASPPFTLTAGQYLRFDAINADTVAGTFRVVVHAFELTA